MSAKQIIVIAPAMSLAEGDIRTGRGEPCWNPPCRRTVLSVAINGIDFVEGAVPIEYALLTRTLTTDYSLLLTYHAIPIEYGLSLDTPPLLLAPLTPLTTLTTHYLPLAAYYRYYFFLDPPRFLNLLDVEFAIYQGALQARLTIPTA